MIPFDEVKILYQHALTLRSKRGDITEDAHSIQLFRGQADVGWDMAHPGGCNRHASIFLKHGVIPKYCFDCYKVAVSPRTIIELFKLTMVFVNLKLPHDNCRKCMVEMRPEITGTYKGLIYCRSFSEAKEIVNIVQDVISEQISKKISITIKRGCSEYSITYPEYANVGDSSTTMEYKPEWKIFEDAVDKNLTYQIGAPDKEKYNHPTYTLKDADTLYYWLRYASALGDMNYLKITGEEIMPLPNLKRAASIIPVETHRVKSAKKLGRNDPCICGSGKKYKHCCKLS